MLGLRRIISCRRGASAIEFAFTAPIVLLMAAGILDFMLVMFVTSLLEGGVRDASRLGRTGFQPAAVSREDAIRTMIADAGIGLIDANKVIIGYTIYPSFQDIGKPEPYEDDSPANGAYDPGELYTDVNGNGQWDVDMGAAGLGQPGDVVLYQVSYNWNLLTPLVGNLAGNGGAIPITASIAVRNEPWNGAPGP